jgi:hypothetical protein
LYKSVFRSFSLLTIWICNFMSNEYWRKICSYSISEIDNRSYNPQVVSWVNETDGVFKISNTNEFAKTWGRMKLNRNAEMNYEKMSRAMRYHYGNRSRKGHLVSISSTFFLRSFYVRQSQKRKMILTT